MRVTEKGQVTIPKRIRTAAGAAPGSEVSFSLEGSNIVITPFAAPVRDDRRAALRGVLGHRPCVACKAFASRRSVLEPARGLSPKG
jgi:AbrB family looped-hinge helix DNA binding protein